MSDKENEPIDQFDDELDFSKLKKKKKSKKKVDFDTEVEATGKPEVAQEAPQEDEEAADADPDAMFADLKKKKKKKSKSVDASEGGEEAPAENEEELDFGAMKKKKKKKKNMAEFEAELGDQDDGETKTEGSSKAGAQEAWLQSDRDYSYEELLGRVFDILRQKNPELVGEKKKYTIVPPQVAREGNKKTIFANVSDISKRLHREPEHVIQFLFAELGTTGSVDGAQRLIIKGRFQQKQIEHVLRRYIVEYVTCKTCKSPDTIMTKDNRLYFVQCEACGSTRSVSAIKTGFKAQTKEDRRALRA